MIQCGRSVPIWLLGRFYSAGCTDTLCSTDTHILCTLPCPQNFTMREAQGGAELCARTCWCSSTPCSPTLTHLLEIHPDPVPFILFFPGLNSPACSLSSPSWCRDHTGIIPWSGCGMSTAATTAGAMGTPQIPSHWDRGQARGQAPSPAEGSPPQPLNKHKHLPPANLAQLRSSGRALPQHNSAR